LGQFITATYHINVVRQCSKEELYIPLSRVVVGWDGDNNCFQNPELGISLISKVSIHPVGVLWVAKCLTLFDSMVRCQVCKSGF
jgi:hypothetical protein